MRTTEIQYVCVGGLRVCVGVYMCVRGCECGWVGVSVQVSGWVCISV